MPDSPKDRFWTLWLGRSYYHGLENTIASYIIFQNKLKVNKLFVSEHSVFFFVNIFFQMVLIFFEILYILKYHLSSYIIDMIANLFKDWLA